MKDIRFNIYTLVVVLFLPRCLRSEEYIVCNHICCEGNDCYAEAREDISKHGPLREDWMTPPSFKLGPWISIEW